MAHSQKRPGSPRNSVRIEDLEDQVYRAMRALGWGLSQTDEEVKQALAELAQQGPVELPAVLRDPNAVWNRVRHPDAGQPPESSSNDAITQALARAAREGGQITPEVEARMRRDREEAEKQDEGK